MMTSDLTQQDRLQDGSVSPMQQNLNSIMEESDVVMFVGPPHSVSSKAQL